MLTVIIRYFLSTKCPYSPVATHCRSTGWKSIPTIFSDYFYDMQTRIYFFHLNMEISSSVELSPSFLLTSIHYSCGKNGLGRAMEGKSDHTVNTSQNYIVVFCFWWIKACSCLTVFALYLFITYRRIFILFIRNKSFIIFCEVLHTVKNSYKNLKW